MKGKDYPKPGVQFGISFVITFVVCGALIGSIIYFVANYNFPYG